VIFWDKKKEKRRYCYAERHKKFVPRLCA